MLGLILTWIFLSILIALLTGFIADSKNRDTVTWGFFTFVTSFFFSPAAGFLLMLAVGLSNAKQKPQPEEQTKPQSPRAPVLTSLQTEDSYENP